jgi:hypothetical protein
MRDSVARMRFEIPDALLPELDGIGVRDGIGNWTEWTELGS